MPRIEANRFGEVRALVAIRWGPLPRCDLVALLDDLAARLADNKPHRAAGPRHPRP